MKLKNVFLIGFIAMILILNLCVTYFVQAEPVQQTESTTYVTLDDAEILVNNEKIGIDTSSNIYLTNAMSNGGSSQNATDANIGIANVINIKNSGIYEFTGNLSDGQIAIDANKIVGNVIIVLNNVNITCKNAPAIFVYNSAIDSSTYTVTIRLAEGSTNTIAGGNIKQSVQGWEDQANLLYYVDKGYDDDKSYYERYKYDGAISSDISLKFEGTGTLNVNALSKEGIESKKHITINSGNYIINSLDDGINACTDGESVITINGGTVLVNVLAEAEEGDGIDSNGMIYINGGNVYAFANEKSQDSGLDSSNGIYINEGYVVATGNMADEVSNASEQAFMQMQFGNKVAKDALITILDESKKPVIAFKTDRAYSILTISCPELQNGEHYVYEGGTIEGVSQNGLYTQITSYQEGTIKEYNDPKNTMMRINDFKRIEDSAKTEEKEDMYFYIMLELGTVLVILVILTIFLVKKGKINIKGNILILIIGMVIGTMITVGVYYHIDKKNETNNVNQNQFEMQGRPDMPMQGQNGGNI